VIAFDEKKIQTPRIDFDEVFALTATVGVTYKANQASKRSAQEAAMMALMHYLYEDTLALLSVAEHAIYSGDPEDVLAAIHKIRKNLTTIPGTEGE